MSDFLSFPEEEQDLLQSVYSQEIQSIFVKEADDSKSKIITFNILHQTLEGSFDLSFTFSKSTTTTTIFSLHQPKISNLSADIDPRVGANFEVFVKKEWIKLVETTFEGANQSKTNSSTFELNQEEQITTSLCEFFMAFFPVILNEFEDLKQEKTSSSSKMASFENNNNGNDDGDEDQKSDDEGIDPAEVEDWSEFFKKQHELKLQRQQKQQEEEEAAKSGKDQRRGPFRTTDEKYFVLIHEYHHIYSSAKQKYMVEKAIDYDLQGIMLRGKPGRCIIEGTFEAVTTWSRLVKSLRWQRCTEVGVFDTLKETDGKAPWIFDSGFGYCKCESESDLKEMLLEQTTTPLAVKFFTYAFPSILVPNRTIS